MTKLNQVVLGAVAVGAVVFIGAQFARQLPGRAPTPTEKLKVGVILPLTGELSFVGQEIEKGIQLALAEDSEQSLEVIVEDDESLTTSKAVSAMHKLAFTDNVDVILNDAVNTAKALVPTVDQTKIPTLVVWDSNEQLRNLHSHMFGFGFSTEKAGQDAAALAVTNLGAKRVAVVSLLDEWSEVIAGAFSQQASSLGAEVVLHEKVSIEEADFRTIITKLKSQEAEVVFFPLFPDGIINFAKQAQELGFEGELITGDGFVGIDPAAEGGVLEGMYAVLPWVTNQDIENKYTAKFGKSDPVSLAFAGLGYDAVKFLAQTQQSLQERQQPVNPETLYSALRQIESNGVTGVTSFQSGNVAAKYEKITVIQNGVLQVAE